MISDEARELLERWLTIDNRSGMDPDAPRLWELCQDTRAYLDRTAPEGSGFDPVERARARGRAQASQPPLRSSAPGAREVAVRVREAFAIPGSRGSRERYCLDVAADAIDAYATALAAETLEKAERSLASLSVNPNQDDGYGLHERIVGNNIGVGACRRVIRYLITEMQGDGGVGRDRARGAAEHRSQRAAVRG